jgi:hypothetical protein
MNATEAIREQAVANLVREHVVDDIEGVPPGATLDGITFDGMRLVLAAADRLVRIRPGSGRVVDTFETEVGPGGLAYDGRHLWQHSGDELQQLELRTGLVLRALPQELDDLTGLACVDDDLLVLHAGGRALARIETLDAKPLTNVETSALLHGLAWLARELWSSGGGEFCRIDPASGRIVARVSMPAGVEVRDLAADDEGRLWCVDGRSRVVRGFVITTAQR